jgi:hypothetical protein
MPPVFAKDVSFNKLKTSYSVVLIKELWRKITLNTLNNNPIGSILIQ